MRTLIAVLFVLALVVVGVGFFRGWFTVSTPAAKEGNKVNVNLEVDRDKMQDDADKVKRKASELTDKVSGGDKKPVDE